MSEAPSATLYRMILPDHVCPFGVRAKDLLEQHGFTVDEHILSSREEVDAFEAKHNVTTTPQVFINDERIGGSDELEEYLARD
jgi:glutaredoxin 3